MGTSKGKGKVVTVAAGTVAQATAPAGNPLAAMQAALAQASSNGSQHNTPAAAPVAPVVAPAPAAPATTVAVRGGIAVAQVALAKNAAGQVVLYRVAAGHNAGWWAQVQAAIAAGNGVAQVAPLVKAGVPAPFIGYVLRRGYLVSA